MSSPKTPLSTPSQIDTSGLSEKSSKSSSTLRRKLSRGVSEIFGAPTVPHLASSGAGAKHAHRGWLIHPHCKYMHRWDSIIGACLTYTVLVTPFEIAFVDKSIQPFSMFAIGAIIDCIFAKDTIMQFFMMYEECTSRGNIWIRDHNKIIKKYLKGWFVIDFVSIFPFSVIMPLILGGGNFGALRNMRVIRVVRLAKLVRLVRGSRALKRFEMNMSISYSHLAICKLFCLMMMVTHWAACFWALTGNAHQDTYEPVQEGWLAILRGNKSHPAEGDIAGIYFAALAYSYASLTGVGYGDIAPTGETEYLIGCFIQVFLGVSWAYIVGNFCGIVASIRHLDSQFEMTMDSLNLMVTDIGIPKPVAKQMRSYFHDLRPAERLKGQQKLISRLSPVLQCEVNTIVHHLWMSKVWYFKHCSKQFLSQVCIHIPVKVFLGGESILAPQAVVALTEGVAIYKMAFFRCGAVWGIENLLKSLINDPKMSKSSFLEHASTQMDAEEDEKAAVAVTNVECLHLSRNLLEPMLKEWPADQKIIRKLVIRSLMRSKIIEWSKRVREQHSQDATRCKMAVKKEVLQEFTSPRNEKKYENVNLAVLGLEEQVNNLKSSLENLPTLMGQFLQRRRAMRTKQSQTKEHLTQEREGHTAKPIEKTATPAPANTIFTPGAIHTAEIGTPGFEHGLDPSNDVVPIKETLNPPAAEQRTGLSDQPEVEHRSNQLAAGISSDQQHSATASDKLHSNPASDRLHDPECKEERRAEGLSVSADPESSSLAMDENHLQSQLEVKKPDPTKRQSLSKNAAERNTSNSIVSGLQPKALAASLAQLLSLQQSSSDMDVRAQIKPVQEAAQKLVAEKVAPCAASFFFHQADVEKNGMLDRTQIAMALQRLPGFGDECIPLFEVKVAELYSEGDGQLDIDEWVDLCKEIPELLKALTKQLEFQGWRRLLSCEDPMTIPGEVSGPVDNGSNAGGNSGKTDEPEIAS